VPECSTILSGSVFGSRRPIWSLRFLTSAYRPLQLFFLAGGALFIGVAVLGIYSRNTRTLELQQLTDKAARTTVQVVHPTRTTEGVSLQLAGQTTPYTDAPIYAQTSGYLKKWHFDIGAEVKSGAVLAEIDTPEVDAELAQAQAELKVAEATRDLSKVTDQRYQYLFQGKVISAQDRDTAADNYRQDEATVNTDRANVNRLEALEAFKIVRAPFDGIVTARNTDIGAYIPLGSGTQLFPGAYVQVTLKIDRADGDLTIPAGTLLFTSGKPSVGAVRPNGTVEIRTITINRDLGSKLEISRGLSESDQIITTPPPGLADGTVVNVLSNESEIE
jgi:multidrug efflux pump subunit AcrA (membrane-fusion protein)